MKTTPVAVRRLDKALFEAGQQCLKRLFLDHREPGADAPSQSRRARSLAGQQLVQLARNAFPRGVEVTGQTLGDQAAQTRTLLAAEGTAFVFGAAFQTDELEVQTDILLRQKDGQLDLFEVKSGTKVNARYLADLAFQVLAIEAAGFRVRAAHILHVNHRYAHKEGEDYPPQQLFKNADVTERVRRAMPRVAAQVRAFRQQAVDASSLELPTGTFCTEPFPCPHLAVCTRDEAAQPLRKLPELTTASEGKLHLEGIASIDELDPQRPGLTFRQQRTVRCVREGQLVVEPFVREELRTVKFPVHYLAITGFTETLPRFTGQRPWRFVPYAWAVETMHENSRLESASFAYADKGDPRSEFIASLAKQVGEGGTLMVWDAAALESLRSLLEDLPGDKAMIRALLGAPRLDLLALFESGVFHPGLLGTAELAAHASLLAEVPPPEDDGLRTPEDVFVALQKSFAPRVRAATKEKIAADLKACCEWQSRAIGALHRRFGGYEVKPAEPAAKPAKARKQLPPSPT